MEEAVLLAERTQREKDELQARGCLPAGCLLPTASGRRWCIVMWGVFSGRPGGLAGLHFTAHIL